MFRSYDAKRDRDAVHRSWREIGWIDDDSHAEATDVLIGCSRSHVADIDDAAECLVLTTPGTVRHLRTDVPMGCVAGVTTSVVARRQGIAGRLTAHAIACDVAAGAVVSLLGMFEQGFYDRLGFGTGSEVHRFGFDPQSMRVPPLRRAPRRVTVDDAEAAHRTRLERTRGHGACTMTPADWTRADLLTDKSKRVTLGFWDGPGGELSHHLSLNGREDMEFGPYWLSWMAWSTPEQYLELLGVIRNLGDQVRLVWVRETHGVQLQVLAAQPFRHRGITKQSKFDASPRCAAYWQMRINDVPKAVAATVLPERATVRFNLEVTDPIEGLLPQGAERRGTGGDYVVTLGPASSAEPGRDGGLPTMRASINAFTRLWLGVRPASALAITDDLEAPADLLERLDWLLCLPRADPDWDF